MIRSKDPYRACLWLEYTCPEWEEVVNLDAELHGLDEEPQDRTLQDVIDYGAELERLAWEAGETEDYIADIEDRNIWRRGNW